MELISASNCSNIQDLRSCHAYKERNGYRCFVNNENMCQSSRHVDLKNNDHNLELANDCISNSEGSIKLHDTILIKNCVGMQLQEEQEKTTK